MEILNHLIKIANLLLAIFLVPSVNADSDNSHAEQFQAVPTCNRVEVPGYPRFYTEMFGFFWDTLECPMNFVFDPLFCECVFSFDVGTALSFTAPQLEYGVVHIPSTPLKTTTSTTTTTTTTTTAAPPSVPAFKPLREAPLPQQTTTTTPVFIEYVKSTPSPKKPTKEYKRRGIVKLLFRLDDIVPKRKLPPITSSPPTTQPTTKLPPTTSSQPTTKRPPTTTSQPTTKRPPTTTTVILKTTSFLPTRTEVVIESGVLSAKSICSGCRFDGGIGYKSHERECDKYVMCSPSGIKGSLRVDVRACGVGEYWDQALLTCRLSTDVPCSTDRCRSRGNWYTYDYAKDCRAYWRCENGVSIGHCCPKGQSYVIGVGCLRNPSCVTNCGLPHIDIGCIKRPVPGNPRKFRQTIEGHGDIDMDCAGGTVFNPDTCDCQTDETIIYASRVCTKELDLAISPEVKDISGKNVHVNGINVTYNSGAVCFHGDSAVVVPRFANADIGNTLDIYLRFKSSDALIRNDLQAVVYNGDCGMDPSIVVAIAKDKIVYTLRNKSNQTRSLTVNLPVKIDKWMTGRFALQNDIMSMTVEGRTENRLFFGDIDRSRCGLKLGWGKQYESFIGCVDKMSVSFCSDSAT